MNGPHEVIHSAEVDLDMMLADFNIEDLGEIEVLAETVEEFVEEAIEEPVDLDPAPPGDAGALNAEAWTQRPDLFRAIVCEVPLLQGREQHQTLA